MRPIHRNLSILTAAACLGWTLAAAAEPLEFLAYGKSVRKLSLEELDKLAPAAPVTVFEPHEKEQRAYLARPANAVLEAVFGAQWRDADSVLFHCADGYKAPVPTQKLQRSKAYLAHARADGQPFELRNELQNDELVKLAPFYLVWDNVGEPALQAEGASGWPYQIVAVELIDPRSRYAKMEPPAGAPPEVQRGYQLFQKECVACHTINGQGGEKSVDLNWPASVTEYWREDWLKRWILDPTTVRYNSLMPPLNPDLPERDKAADDLLAYLRAMAQHKQKPDDAP